MHMFLISAEDTGASAGPGAFAHVHPVARTPDGLDFDVALPVALPPGHYRVYSDIVHESGYAQTLVSTIELPAASGRSNESVDPDDSWFDRAATPMTGSASFAFGDGIRIVAAGGPFSAGSERELQFSMVDAAGATLPVEPYMGMAAHVALANRDGSVFAHLHPSGSVSMAALQKMAGQPANGHDGHVMAIESVVAIPYAFPKTGSYRLWVQMKREGAVHTAAFDVDVR